MSSPALTNNNSEKVRNKLIITHRTYALRPKTSVFEPD
ncbi:hypothetical protein AVDCRST_MAG84-729 [uncultured Microcoleus sp.]|uniref:Uncharacterized protein n=1 Tax=uncultured Microcoleus sp. TaxID=259945 RepID=A0A6J4KPX5_9CYAN|nr:hypothetical protein AVDCRST_MAG84-729 [uncultured Microcoleus sp.]